MNDNNTHNLGGPTPPLDVFLRAYEADDNEVCKRLVDDGHVTLPDSGAAAGRRS